MLCENWRAQAQPPGKGRWGLTQGEGRGPEALPQLSSWGLEVAAQGPPFDPDGSGIATDH